jgi:glycosyltransferase involved in cell wall biosynthesis
MRRVIYAWNYLEWGGSQIHFLALIKEARKYFDVVVVLPEGSSEQFLGFLDQLGIRYEFFGGHENSLPAHNIVQKFRLHFQKLKSELAMIRRIRQLSPISAVHVDLGPHQSLLTLALLALLSPVFITSHNRLPEVGKFRTSLWKLKFGIISLFNNFHVFCSNEDARAYFKSVYSRRIGDAIDVTYTSIDPEQIDNVLSSEFDRSAVLRALGLPRDRPVVLAVGQFIDRKGRWVFLEAAAKVLKQTDALFVWMAPKQPGDNELERVRNVGLGNAFRIVLSDSIGTSRQDVLNFFRIANIFALPSFVEGLPIALLEAMALGIPSISTNVNGIPEAVRDEDTGLLIEPGDADALAKGVRRLLSDKGFATAIAHRGRNFVMKQFDEREAARIAVRRYKSVIARK